MPVLGSSERKIPGNQPICALPVSEIFLWHRPSVPTVPKHSLRAQAPLCQIGRALSSLRSFIKHHVKIIQYLFLKSSAKRAGAPGLLSVPEMRLACRTFRLTHPHLTGSPRIRQGRRMMPARRAEQKKSALSHTSRTTDTHCRNFSAGRYCIVFEWGIPARWRDIADRNAAPAHAGMPCKCGTLSRL